MKFVLSLTTASDEVIHSNAQFPFVDSAWSNLKSKMCVYCNLHSLCSVEYMSIMSELYLIYVP